MTLQSSHPEYRKHPNSCNFFSCIGLMQVYGYKFCANLYLNLCFHGPSVLSSFIKYSFCTSALPSFLQLSFFSYYVLDPGGD